MTGPADRTREAERTVAILAPSGLDGELLLSVASEGGPAFAVADGAALSAAIRDGRADVVVLTQDALTDGLVADLARETGRLDPWHEVPLLVLVDAEANTVDAVRRLEQALPQMRVLVRQRPVRPVEMAGTLVQMRRTRARQMDLGRHLDRERQLRRELNHRVKNILSSVQGLYHLTARASPSEAAFHAAFSARLDALARIHAVLFAQDYADVPLAPAIAAALAPFAEGADDSPIRLEFEPVMMGAEAALALALAVHELAADAAESGMLDAGGPPLRVRLSAAPDHVRLDWHVPQTAEQPELPSGFGARFVRSTVRQWGGTVAFGHGEDGLLVQITIPHATLSGIRGAGDGADPPKGNGA